MKITNKDTETANRWLSQHGGPEWVGKNTPILAGMFAQIREDAIDACYQAATDAIITAGAQNVLKAIRALREE